MEEKRINMFFKFVQVHPSSSPSSNQSASPSSSSSPSPSRSTTALCGKELPCVVTALCGKCLSYEAKTAPRGGAPCEARPPLGAVRPVRQDRPKGRCAL
jgi:hypothetical protein